jgi:type IV pilus assembly protein PilX
MKPMTFANRQQGAALVVGLILLVVVTVLAIAGMNTATTELAIARNDQNYENAFQAAETGIETALSQGRFDTLVNTTLEGIVVPVRDNDSVRAVIRFDTSTLVPDRAFSLGVGSGIAAYHFTATAEAESAMTAGNTDRDASAVHTQAFYVVGPEAPTL